MSSKCTGIAGFLFGHKFLPVITKGAAMCKFEAECGLIYTLRVLDAYRPQTFHSVFCCKRCGEIREKP